MIKNNVVEHMNPDELRKYIFHLESVLTCEQEYRDANQELALCYKRLSESYHDLCKAIEYRNSAISRWKHFVINDKFERDIEEKYEEHIPNPDFYKES